jgi:hypothetical protein
MVMDGGWKERGKKENILAFSHTHGQFDFKPCGKKECGPVNYGKFEEDGWSI